jgi:hypothetical protein
MICVQNNVGDIVYSFPDKAHKFFCRSKPYFALEAADGAVIKALRAVRCGGPGCDFCINL